MAENDETTGETTEAPAETVPPAADQADGKSDEPTDAVE